MKGSQRLSLLVATLALLLLIVWSAAHPTLSSAHAFPSRSTPEAGSVLEGPPSRVDIWFTERVTPRVSSIEVFDLSGRRVDSGDSTVDPQDPFHLSVGVTTLPTGLYTVVWSNVSADDGHPNKGGYAFTVLEPTATPLPAIVGAQGTPSVAPTPVSTTTPLPLPSEADQAATQLLNPATDRPTAAVDLVAGWLAFSALVLAGGGAAFVLLCLLPAFGTSRLVGSTLPPLVGRFLILVVLYGIVGAVGAFVSLLAKAEIATGLPPGDLMSGVVLGALLEPWSGRVWLVREAALLAMAALGIAGLVLRRRAPVPKSPLAGIAILGAVGVVFQALGSHVAAGHVARPWPLGAPVLALHLLAVGLWVGGLGFAPLLWPVWKKASAEARAALTAGAIARFSTLALPSVVVIAFTGTYLALVLLPLPGDLLSSSYGQAIDVKTALFVVLLGFGALNRGTLRTVGRRSPSERPDGGATAAVPSQTDGTASELPVGVSAVLNAGTRLLRAMRRELALAAVVLLAAGAMLEVGPPGAALSAQAVKLEDSVALAAVPDTPTPVPTAVPAVYAAKAVVGDLTLALDATPTLAGATTAFTVSVAGANGAPVSGAQVKLFLTAASTDLGSQALTLSAEAPGQYHVAAPVFALAGNWNVQLVVRRDNVPERDQTFVVPVRAPALPATPTPVTTTVQPTPIPQRLDGALALQPDPPMVGRDHVTLRLRDAAGRPVAGAQVLGLWLMPEHAHLEQSSLPETIAAPGTYEADVPLSMAGAWLADINVRMADGRAAHVRFAFNVRDRGLLGAAAPITRPVALASAPPNTTAAAAVEAAPLATLSPEAPGTATSEAMDPATPAPAVTSAIADSIRAPPSTVAPSAAVTAPTAATATSDSGLSQRQRMGDLDVDARITPRVFQPAAIDVQLAKPDGTTPTDVTRVDVQFAMDGMSHGARGMVATPDGPGRYQAQGMVLVMEGPWWMALRIERAGGRVDSGVFGFRVPADRPSGAVSALTDRPNDPVQIVDIAVYPGGVDPPSVVVHAGHPVRLEVVFVDRPPCGPEVQVTSLGLRAAVTSSGLAELSFVPTSSATLRIDCEQAGLFLRAG